MYCFRKAHFIIWVIFSFIVFLIYGCNSGNRGPKVDLKERVKDEELKDILLKERKDIYLFGFDLRSSPQEDARQYLPFLKYLEKATGYNFEIHFSSRESSVVHDLGSGVVQFAAIGAGSYIVAHEQFGAIPVARGVNNEGKAEYHSLIIVLPDSPLQKVEDLRGKRIAFGSITSTQGHIIPRVILAKRNITLNDLDFYEYTGSHQNCANALLSGRFHACFIQDTLGQNLADAGIVRILFESMPYPSSGISANRNVAPEVIAKVRKALLDFQPRGRDAQGLYKWDRTEMPNGFISADDEDYEYLSKWIKKLEIFKEIFSLNQP